MSKLIMSNIDALKVSMFTKVKHMNNEMFESVAAEAVVIMEESKQEVPVDTTTLQSIADVVVCRSGEFAGYINIGYGISGDVYNEKSKAWATSYAMKVHEDLSAEHTIGKAKFFEDPVNRGKIRIKRHMNAAARRWWK